MNKISPKVYVPTALAVLAGLALYLLTGNESTLLVTLTGIASGGIGAAAPPAPGLEQLEVDALAKKKAATR